MLTTINCRWKCGVFIMTVYIGLLCEIYFNRGESYLIVTGLHDNFFLNKKIILYFYPVMLSDDPMGHTQSKKDKHSSEKPSERVIGYLTCFMC